MSNPSKPYMEDSGSGSVIKDVLQQTADLLTVEPGTISTISKGGVPKGQEEQYLKNQMHPIRVARNDKKDDMDTVMNTWDASRRFDQVTGPNGEDLGYEPGAGVTDILKSVDDNLVHGTADIVQNVDQWMTRNSYGSPTIVARARNSILQFPIYCTATLPVNQAHVIGKLYERVYTTFVQTVVSQNQIISEDEANNLLFLRKYHTNLQEAAKITVNEFYKPIDRMDEILQESVFYSCEVGPGMTMEFKFLRECPDDIIHESARLAGDQLQGFSYLREAGETETTTRKETIRSSLSEEDLRTMAANRIGISSTDLRLASMSNMDIKKDTEARWDNPDDQNGLRDEIQDQIYNRDNIIDQIDQATEQLKNDLKLLSKPVNTLSDEEKVRYQKLSKTDLANFEYRAGRFFRTDTKASSTTSPARPVQTPPAPVRAQNLRDSSPAVLLKDNEIKKLNGMQPYAMEIAMRVQPKQGDAYTIRYVIGIKSVLHLIYAKDLCDDIRELVTGRMRKLQKVRYKTGEISWMDYMFNVSGMKNDAMKRMDPHKRWLQSLKKLAEYRQIHGSLWSGAAKELTGKDMPIPNGTLILDHLDVDYITQNSGIDLNVIGYARRLCNSLFLLSIAIVDSTAGTMKVFFPDQDQDWDIQSLDAIQAELTKMDNNPLMKELQKRIMATR